MTVQQRLATGEQLLEAQRVVRGRTRRAVVRQLVRDIACGAESLGELDFAGACRRRGLPEPSRQAVRELPGGRAYLDVAFEEYDLVVEIDGAGHLWGLAAVDDALRANEVVLGAERVLRINVLASGSRRTPSSTRSPAGSAREGGAADPFAGRGISDRTGGLPYLQRAPSLDVPSAVEVSATGWAVEITSNRGYGRRGERARGERAKGGRADQEIQSLQPWCSTSHAMSP